MEVPSLPNILAIAAPLYKSIFRIIVIEVNYFSKSRHIVGGISTNLKKNEIGPQSLYTCSKARE
jgi:hypothetical protein